MWKDRRDEGESERKEKTEVVIYSHKYTKGAVGISWGKWRKETVKD